MPETFCLDCFAKLWTDEKRCPACGADLSALTERQYRDKLLHALRHPLADVRLRAVIALGWRGEKSAARELVALALRDAADVVQGIEIVRALARLRGGWPHVHALEALAARHPASAVRRAAREALAAGQPGGR